MSILLYLPPIYFYHYFVKNSKSVFGSKSKGYLKMCRLCTANNAL